MSQTPNDSLDQWTIQNDVSNFKMDPTSVVGQQSLEHLQSDDVLTADASSSHTNVRLEFAYRLRETTGGNNNHAGLAFGYQDMDNFYRAVFSFPAGKLINNAEIWRVDSGNESQIIAAGSLNGNPPEWVDCRIDVWQSTNGISVRFEATERGDTPFSGLSEILTYTMGQGQFIGEGPFTPGQVGLTIFGLSNHGYIDDIRMYWD